jgi:hypothetical protein
MEQGIDQRAARMAGSRVHDHARRLVDHDHVAVLIQDGQRQLFGRGTGSTGSAISMLTRCPAFTG